MCGYAVPDFVTFRAKMNCLNTRSDLHRQLESHPVSVARFVAVFPFQYWGTL